MTPDPPGLAIEERIRGAIVDLVAAQGIDPVTTEAVCARAGVTREDFESRFSDPRACFDQVWDEMSAGFMAGFRTAPASGASWRERIRATAYYTLRYFQEDETRTRFFMVGSLSAGEAAMARRDRMIEMAVELVDDGRQDLEQPEAVSISRAEAAVGAIYEALGSAAARNGKLEGDLVPQLMYLTVLPYLGIEAAKEELLRGPEDIRRYERGEI